ncbi:MAG: prephenate dehydratase [Candidatus Latescibacteria bacterium]|nr:prephenate dehydratase [Candidatus Latescibacterota bacterium]
MGAFSEMAARAYFHEGVAVAPQADFAALFAAVEEGSCSHGMVPIENSLMGSIHENYDLLLEHNLQIVGELKLRIVHNLIANKGVRLGDIRYILSQPPALAQCTQFIRSLEEAEAVVAADTAGAVQQLKESGSRDSAAIASTQAAIDYDLEILQAGVENDHQNYTRFLVVAPRGVEVEEAAKTSLVFACDNEPGALFKSICVFALRDINLLKIESRPLTGKPWEYAFYLDLEGHMGQESCQRAVRHLEELATFVKILGSYRVGETVEGKVRAKKE